MLMPGDANEQQGQRVGQSIIGKPKGWRPEELGREEPERTENISTARAELLSQGVSPGVSEKWNQVLKGRHTP